MNSRRRLGYNKTHDIGWMLLWVYSFGSPCIVLVLDQVDWDRKIGQMRLRSAPSHSSYCGLFNLNH